MYGSWLDAKLPAALRPLHKVSPTVAGDRRDDWRRGRTLESARLKIAVSPIHALPPPSLELLLRRRRWWFPMSPRPPALWLALVPGATGTAADRLHDGVCSIVSSERTTQWWYPGVSYYRIWNRYLPKQCPVNHELSISVCLILFRVVRYYKHQLHLVCKNVFRT